MEVELETEIEGRVIVGRRVVVVVVSTDETPVVAVVSVDGMTFVADSEDWRMVLAGGEVVSEDGERHAGALEESR